MIGIIGSRPLVESDLIGRFWPGLAFACCAIDIGIRTFVLFRWMYTTTSLSLYTVFHHHISDVILLCYCLLAFMHHWSRTQKDWSCADGLLEQEGWRARISHGVAGSHGKGKQYYTEDVSQKR